MKVELLNDEPVYHRLSRMSMDERDKLNNLVMTFQSSGISRESTQSYASHDFLVSTKEGEGRMVFAFRKLNIVTKLIKYSLPFITDQIDRLGGYMYFVSFDLKFVFYQIPAHSASIEKTAFITPDGHREFLKMVMGLAN